MDFLKNPIKEIHLIDEEKSPTSHHYNQEYEWRKSMTSPLFWITRVQVPYFELIPFTPFLLYFFAFLIQMVDHLIPLLVFKPSFEKLEKSIFPTSPATNYSKNFIRHPLGITKFYFHHSTGRTLKLKMFFRILFMWNGRIFRHFLMICGWNLYLPIMIPVPFSFNLPFRDAHNQESTRWCT